MLISKKAVKMIVATQGKKVGRDFHAMLERQVNDLILGACKACPKVILKAEDLPNA
jgi:hypothetical protein